MAMRKLIEPAYGEVAPEVYIRTPEMMDLDNPELWRAKNNQESCAAFTQAISKCNCYGEIMKVPVEHRYAANGDVQVP